MVSVSLLIIQAHKQGKSILQGFVTFFGHRFSKKVTLFSEMELVKCQTIQWQ